MRLEEEAEEWREDGGLLGEIGQLAASGSAGSCLGSWSRRGGSCRCPGARVERSMLEQSTPGTKIDGKIYSRIIRDIDKQGIIIESFFRFLP